MGLFERKVRTAAYGAADVKAAVGMTKLSDFTVMQQGTLEQRAISIPAISRARDLMASQIGSLELKHYQRTWLGENYEEVNLPLETWMDRPDPKVSRQFIMANTFSDLFFYGAAVWVVTTRYSNGFPATFQWIPKASVNFPDQPGPQFFGPPKTIEFNGQRINPSDCVVFLSPTQGMVYQGHRAINIAIHLDQYADRLATLETVPGYLQQVGGESMSGEDLTELAAGWGEARRRNMMGALNDMVEFREYKNSPAEVLDEARRYQALELSRLANIPANLLGIDIGGYNYVNAKDSNAQLYLYGTKLYLDCIEQRLSMDDVLPRGRYVSFDVSEYIMDEVAEMNRMEDTVDDSL